MSLFSFKKPRPLLVLQEQGAEVVGGMKEVAVSTFAHIDALVRLLRLELQQYAALQMRRVVLMAVGGLLLFVGYLVFCACACVAAHAWLGSWLWATGLVCAVHLIVGLVILLIGFKSSPGPVAPATRQEIQHDLECLKILISKESSKS